MEIFSLIYISPITGKCHEYFNCGRSKNKIERKQKENKTEKCENLHMTIYCLLDYIYVSFRFCRVCALSKKRNCKSKHSRYPFNLSETKGEKI